MKLTTESNSRNGIPYRLLSGTINTARYGYDRFNRRGKIRQSTLFGSTALGLFTDQQLNQQQTRSYIAVTNAAWKHDDECLDPIYGIVTRHLGNTQSLTELEIQHGSRVFLHLVNRMKQQTNYPEFVKQHPDIPYPDKLLQWFQTSETLEWWNFMSGLGFGEHNFQEIISGQQHPEKYGISRLRINNLEEITRFQTQFCHETNLNLAQEVKRALAYRMYTAEQFTRGWLGASGLNTNDWQTRRIARLTLAQQTIDDLATLGEDCNEHIPTPFTPPLDGCTLSQPVSDPKIGLQLGESAARIIDFTVQGLEIGTAGRTESDHSRAIKQKTMKIGLKALTLCLTPLLARQACPPGDRIDFTNRVRARIAYGIINPQNSITSIS